MTVDEPTADPRPITNALNAQGPITPGTEGWWKVWGAHAAHVQVDDMVMVRWEHDGVAEYGEYEIAELLGDNVVSRRFRSTDGRTFRIGALQPIVLLRRGTHHTLAP